MNNKLGYVKLTISFSYEHSISKSSMQIRFERNRTSTIVIMYSLYLYFLIGLSLKNASRAFEPFKMKIEIPNLY